MGLLNVFTWYWFATSLPSLNTDFQPPLGVHIHCSCTELLHEETVLSRNLSLGTTDILFKVMTIFCAWDGCPPLLVTTEQLMRPAWYWLNCVLRSGWLYTSDLSSQGKPERAEHGLTNLSLHKAGFVTQVYFNSVVSTPGNRALHSTNSASRLTWARSS